MTSGGSPWVLFFFALLLPTPFPLFTPLLFIPFVRHDSVREFVQFGSRHLPTCLGQELRDPHFNDTGFSGVQDPSVVGSDSYRPSNPRGQTFLFRFFSFAFDSTANFMTLSPFKKQTNRRIPFGSKYSCITTRNPAPLRPSLSKGLESRGSRPSFR